MMESVDPQDRHLDPPNEPTRGECDGCGEEFDNGDLTRVGGPGNYKWLCVDCEDNWQHLMDSLEYDEE